MDFKFFESPIFDNMIKIRFHILFKISLNKLNLSIFAPKLRGR